MPNFAPDLLARWTGGDWTAAPAAPLTGFTIDTRQLRGGQVFVALKTDRRDGHDYLPDALAAGAAAALVRRAEPSLALPQLVVDDPLAAFQTIAGEHRRRFAHPVTGISGSAGKTSTKDLLTLLLGGADRGLATEGNLNNHLGVPLTLARLDPDRHEFAVVEAGISAPGEMRPLGEMIQPEIGLITLVAPAHVQALGGLDGVAREKAELLRHVRPGGLAILPRQCWDFAPFRSLPGKTLVVAPAGEIGPAGRTVFFHAQAAAEQTELVLGESRRFTLRRVSAGMAQNAVLAILAASELGRSDEAIQRALAGWQPARWRGEIRREAGRLLYLDCYNANPASLADALAHFDAITPPEEPRLLVIGGMEELGAAAADYHRAAGRRLRLRPRDFLFLIGDHAGAVREGALANGNSAGQMAIVTDLGPVRSRLAAFHGAVFLKGSRRYELENALEPGTPPRVGTPPTACAAREKDPALPASR